ncbi:hypothetical protein QBC35DRAFT_391769 [Podospora australis]|uniref:Uncharacterized protein n=1 Tax=Podospora australis TaxID=1536484 RepID=A0AAN7AFW6_9PEZI|nr:hypothetical protein QBC35DRAFT_391769 [Podospora australis]
MRHVAATHDGDEELNDAAPTAGARRCTQRASWQRLDSTHLVALLLGSAILPITFIILGLLWRESIAANKGGEARELWYRLIEGNWTTRIVTICTAVMRTVVALQASVATAMTAALVLERIGTPFLDGPFYSILRALEVSPYKLLTRTSTHWLKSFLSFSVYLLVIIEVMVTMSSQFLSTILLSDFRSNATLIGGSNKNISVPGLEYATSSGPFWSVAPWSRWTLGESPRAASLLVTDHSEDTGHTYRSFLPFELENQRTKLRKFHGPALIMDNRVVCTRPKLRALRRVQTLAHTRISGQLAINTQALPLLRLSGAQPPGSYLGFNCSFSTPGFKIENGPLANRMRGGNSDCTSCIEATSVTFLILHVLDSPGIVIQDSNQTVHNIRNNGPWANITDGSSKNTDAVRMTACFSNLGSHTFLVDMESSWDIAEPNLAWDPKANSYRTETSLRQLGALGQQELFATERGSLTLNPPAQWQHLPNQTGRDRGFEDHQAYRRMWESFVVNLPNNQDSGLIFASQHHYSGIVGGYAHKTHADIFLDTLRTTGSPALALQGFLTRVCQMTYYNKLGEMTNNGIASVSLESTAAMPIRWTGFIAALFIIVTHLVIIATVTVLFLRLTDNSFIGNHWQAVAQAISEDTLPILEKADRMKDNEVLRRDWTRRQRGLHSDNLDLRKRFGKLRYYEPHGDDDARVAFAIFPVEKKRG